MLQFSQIFLVLFCLGGFVLFLFINNFGFYYSKRHNTMTFKTIKEGYVSPSVSVITFASDEDVLQMMTTSSGQNESFDPSQNYPGGWQ